MSTCHKNIIIYTHMSGRDMSGGTVVQYYLAKLLEEYGQNVRIYTRCGSKPDNGIYDNFYNNDFPIDDNTVVVYCEGTLGNPLNAKNVVRWMLSELGKNVPYESANTWGKNELVYYFNSEIKFDKNPEKIGIVYKLLSCLYTNPVIKQYNFEERTGCCYAIRKAFWHTVPIQFYQINEPAFELPYQIEHSECAEYFNKYKFFISYDPCTFLTMMAAICGCISIVYPRDNMTKQEWIQTTAANEYIKSKGLDNLYGIAYGIEDIQYAIDTIHLVKDQWIDIQNFCNEKMLIPFINDIQNFEILQNTIQNNYF